MVLKVLKVEIVCFNGAILPVTIGVFVQMVMELWAVDHKKSSVHVLMLQLVIIQLTKYIHMLHHCNVICFVYLLCRRTCSGTTIANSFPTIIFPYQCDYSRIRILKISFINIHFMYRYRSRIKEEYL